MLSGLLNGLSLIDDQEEGTISFMFSDGNYSLIHLSLNVQGNTKDIIWNYNKNNWEVVWKALQSEYDVYGKWCGAFGSCNSQSSPICSCLLGSKPNNTEEWNRRNWTSGCVRSTPVRGSPPVVKSVKWMGF